MTAERLDNCTAFTNVRDGVALAAAHSQIVCILLRVQLDQVQVPDLKVSVGASGHKHLATRSEAAGHHSGIGHGSCPTGESVCVCV